MNRIFTIIVLSLVSITLLPAQARFWEELNGAPNFSLTHESEDGAIFASYESFSSGNDKIGLYVSRNGGVDWGKTQFNVNIEELEGTGKYVIVQLDGNDNFSTRYYSSDNGNSWVALQSTPNSPYSFSLSDSGEIFALSGRYNRLLVYEMQNRRWRLLGDTLPWFASVLKVDHAKNFFATSFSNGIYISTNLGDTWATVLPLNKVTALFVTSENNIIAGAQPYFTNDGGVYISSDTGKTWDSLGLPLTTISVLTEDSQGRIYASTNEGIYRYVDSTEWEFIGPSASQFDDFLITRSNVFIATASSQGLYRSSDYGRVWEKTTTINSEDVSAMYVDKQNAIYAGTMGNSIFSSSFIGTGWRQTPLGTTGSEITSFTGIDTFLFAGTDEGLYRTSNRGLTWTNITSSTFGGTAHSVAVNSGKEVFVGTNFGLYYSTDYGDSWQAAGLASQQVFHVAIDPSDKIAVSTGDSGIFVSQDNGASWDYAGLAGEDIISMAVNYAGEIFAGGYGGVSRSTDNGLSWIQRTFDNTYVLALATRGRQVFAGTYNGVFTSTNNGDTWSAMSKSGLKTYTVLSLTFDNLGNLVAGIYQGGVYRTLQSYTGVNERDELPGAFVLNQNYPNPFNPSTVIRYLLSVNGNVTLKVYDVLGREVATLVDEFQASGFKSQVFDASGLASGVYFYTLTVVGHDGIMSYTDVKKMLLIR